MNPTIRPANLNDVPGIMAVLEQNLMTNKINVDEKILQEKGFLLKAFTADELRTAIIDDNNHIVLVAAQADTVFGYALSYDLYHVQPDWLSAINVPDKIKKILTTAQVIYHRHIAKDANTKAVGHGLLNTLTVEAQNRGYKYILCFIAHTPIKNHASIRLHEKLGFTEVGTKIVKDGMHGVYLKEL